MFKSVSPIYQEALKNAGYNYELKFKPENSYNQTTQDKNLKRNILWFNPPYSQGVRTNVGAKFLKLIRKHYNYDFIIYSKISKLKNNFKINKDDVYNKKICVVSPYFKTEDKLYNEQEIKKLFEKYNAI